MRIGLALACLVAGSASAQDRGARAEDASFEDPSAEWVPPPKDRLYYTNATFIRVNPLGLIDVFRLGWRRRLSSSDSLLLKDTYTFVAAGAIVTPAWARAGLYVEAQPLAILRVFGELAGQTFFGTFDQVLSWDDPASRYSDRTLAELGAQGLATPRSGWVATAGGVLQAKVGPVAIRSTFQATRFDLALPDGDVVFYDQYWDRLAPDGGWMAVNDLDVMAVAGKLRAGARYTASAQLTDRTDGADGSLGNHRVGPLVAWQFRDDPPGKRFNQPTAFLVAQWWVRHPYRSGEEQPLALPLIAAGLAFNGDLRP